jgi:hypothetical protein
MAVLGGLAAPALTGVGYGISRLFKRSSLDDFGDIDSLAELGIY